MIITADVYTNNGVVIVPKGTCVTKEVYDLLTRHFVEEVIVEYDTGKKSKEKIRNKEFKQSFHIAEEVLSLNLKEIVQQDKEVDIHELYDVVQNVAAKADNDVELCKMLHNIEITSENLYTHSVNVALYAQLLARWAGLSEEYLEMVVLAGLLHDIGHLQYSETAQGFLCLHEELEHRYQEKHALYGYKMLKNKTLKYQIKQAVLTHHEYMNGKGFPMGVSFENINDISRILAIADSYAVLSVEEPGYPSMSPFELLNYMHSQEFCKFDSSYLLIFIEHVAQNFIRHEVLLNNGKKGVVVMLNKMDLTRPLVQVGEQFVDLAIHKELNIVKLLG